MTEHARAHPPLEGLRVIDLSQLIAGPSCTHQLAALGADVVKIEPPSGDLARRVGPAGAPSSTFLAYHRGKRSLVLDLKSAEGRKAFAGIARRADVLVEAFKPGTMASWGLGYEDVVASNPGLIYVALTAFDRADPARRPGVDAVVQAESGIMAINGPADGAPCKVGFQLIDGAAGLAMAQAVLAAVIHRMRTGSGTRVDVSLEDVARHIQAPMFVEASRRGAALPRPGNTAGHLGYPTDLFETADGRFIMIAAYFETQWPRLCRALDRESIATCPEYATNTQRMAHQEVLADLLRDRFAAETLEFWRERLSAEGVIFGVVRDHHEIVSAREAEATPRFESYEEYGSTYHVPRLPATFSAFDLASTTVLGTDADPTENPWPRTAPGLDDSGDSRCEAPRRQRRGSS